MCRTRSLHDVNLHNISLAERRHRNTERSRSCHSQDNDMQGGSSSQLLVREINVVVAGVFVVIRCQRIGEQQTYEEIEIEIPREVYKRFNKTDNTNQLQENSKSIRSKYEQLKRRFVKI